MNKNMPLPEETYLRLLKIRFKVFLFILILIGNHAIISGQNQNSFRIKTENQNPFSKEVIDSILKNNTLCHKFSEVVRLDTLYWWQYPPVNLDSVAQLHGKTADELAEKALDLKHSKHFSDRPFNLIGTYSETEMRNSAKSSNDIKTKVMVYDAGIVSNHLPKARTEKNYYFFKSPDITLSEADIRKFSLAGSYSNLYYLLDCDFLRMYHVPSSDNMEGDRRIWSEGKNTFSDIPDSFRYYKSFIKDRSIYIVLVAKRFFSMDDYVKSHSRVMIIDNSGRKSITSVYKYLLINLNTNVIEKTGYYRIDSESYRNSSTLSPYSATSYETSYRLVGNRYYLDHIHVNDYLFRPQINHISLSGISFQVDSVITEPSKVIKIKDSHADPRKVNYLDYCISLDSLFRNNGNK